MLNRKDIEFLSDGIKCRGWLYLPGTVRPSPVIIMGHGLGGVKEMRLNAFAERFCSEGYAVLVFDYRHFGASAGSPRQLLDIKRQLKDWESAIAFARNLTMIDTKRVILWGTSFGGGHVLVTASNDQNVAAVISQCPFTNGFSSTFAMDLQTSLKVSLFAIFDKAGSFLGFPPLFVNTSGEPGTAALMTAPDVKHGILPLLTDATNFENKVAARVALDIPFYVPGRKTPNINCPVLFCVCATDTVAPSKATLRHARKAPMGDVRVYPDGHFDIYVGNAFERVVSDQIRFLKHHIPVV